MTAKLVNCKITYHLSINLTLLKPVDEILGGRPLDSGVLAKECCAAEPLVTCYYMDLPSKIACSDSPKKEPNGKDFWGE